MKENVPNGRAKVVGGLTTSQLADALRLKADSIRKRFCQTGSYFGITPEKMMNGRLRWPDDSLERLVKAHGGTNASVTFASSSDGSRG